MRARRHVQRMGVRTFVEDLVPGTTLYRYTLRCRPPERAAAGDMALRRNIITVHKGSTVTLSMKDTLCLAILYDEVVRLKITCGIDSRIQYHVGTLLVAFPT